MTHLGRWQRPLTPNTAVVQTVSANPSTGIAPIFPYEPGWAWWRVNVSLVTAINGVGA